MGKKAARGRARGGLLILFSFSRRKMKNKNFFVFYATEEQRILNKCERARHCSRNTQLTGSSLSLTHTHKLPLIPRRKEKCLMSEGETDYKVLILHSAFFLPRHMKRHAGMKRLLMPALLQSGGCASTHFSAGTPATSHGEDGEAADGSPGISLIRFASLSGDYGSLLWIFYFSNSGVKHDADRVQHPHLPHTPPLPEAA